LKTEVPAMASRSCLKVIFGHTWLVWSRPGALGHTEYPGEVRKSEEWVIGVIVAWSPGF